MKDDIDSILDSMFKNGRLNFHTAKQNSENAQQALDQAEQANQAASRSLQSSIEKLTRETQAQLAELDQRMQAEDAPGQISSSAPKEPPKPSLTQDVETAFQKAREQVHGQVVGQEAFVTALGVAFKRPLIVGIKPEMPSSRSLILGQNGTGKHLALQAFAQSLQQNGVLQSGKIVYLDLSKYREAQDEILFIQDIYAAVSDAVQIIVFENFEFCHNTVLGLISALYLDGKFSLANRYAAQKGILVNIGNALVKNAVSTIGAEGKYLFLMTDKNEEKLMDSFGAQFLSSCDDVCRTVAFTPEDLEKIAVRTLESMCENTKKRLGIQLSFEKSEGETLAAKFVPESGVHSILNYTHALSRVLGDYKLRSGKPHDTGKIISEKGDLLIQFEGETVSAAGTTAASSAALEAVKQELTEIIGLKNVKDYIFALEDNFKVQQMRKKKGMRTEFPSMHMIFTGNPGTGKTTIARIVSRYLKAIGVLSGGQLIEVTRADLVGRYVGHTAPLTQKAIQSALGGVLFIDEAYSLYRGNDDSYGLEAIDTLVKGMEDNRENLVVILAGYSMEMAEFLTANSGLKSRFPNQIAFPDYMAQELVDITKRIVRQKGYTLEEGADEALFVYYDIAQNTGDPRTNGNGRMARNKVEEAVLNCSKRNIAAAEEEINLELLRQEDFCLTTPEA